MRLKHTIYIFGLLLIRCFYGSLIFVPNFVAVGLLVVGGHVIKIYIQVIESRRI